MNDGMPLSRAVFFDVDGVLLDSLPQHLLYCAAKAREYGLIHLKMPTVQAFKDMVGRRVPVSPMLNCFLAVGFPQAEARRAVQDYEREFVQRFPAHPFEGIASMLARLQGAGFLLGLVTANVKENIEPGLRGVIPYFDSRCMFYLDRGPAGKTKSDYLREGADILQLNPSSCTYVGDQPADADAAHSAGMQFLGVSYGWSIDPGERRERTVASVAEIAAALTGS